ncbi:Piso0_005652 [Millerozyma farinosa CBS 7064]|uniref:Piso0_005652 protein n=1 Tax=Pichia sorbitophila (strain ATCC MYA-4447 / BCRC 22081 / CBS 7064 / NBRC 10061 / NRRL Y-12695) TaxID=559304 RepID=G8Y2J7_PICSO|nr:Piso0_005652 [Millerozyma farinosa CBS 7064]
MPLTSDNYESAEAAVMHNEGFHPDALIERLAEYASRSSVSDLERGAVDPIVEDLKKLTAHRPVFASETQPVVQRYESVNRYSAQLVEVLHILVDGPQLDEGSRIAVESHLFYLTSYIPKPDPEFEARHGVFYPNEQISKILIDNYNSLLKFVSTYFNLSLTSHVTRYMVELIYSLQYWEVYHLLYLLPELEHFLKLVHIDVFQTPFGPLVKPPENLLKDSMIQGLQFPFPYPFYNYSYHSFDPNSVKNKLSKINITPYIDIKLRNTEKPQRNKRTIESSYNTGDSARDEAYMHTPKNKGRVMPRVREGGSQQSINLVHPIPSVPVSNPQSAIQDAEESFLQQNSTIHDSSDQSEDETLFNHSADGDENKVFFDNGEIKTENGEKSLHGKEGKKGKSKSGVIHQCHLIDPNSMKPCLKIFYGKNELLRHQEFVHATKKKIYKCIYCSRNGTKVQSYPRHDSLARHIRRKHGITGKENKMAVNYAKENVEIIDDPNKYAFNQSQKVLGKPLPRPQFLNSDFTIKSSYAGFLSFSARHGSNKSPLGSSSKGKESSTDAPDPKSTPSEPIDVHFQPSPEEYNDASALKAPEHNSDIP